MPVWIQLLESTLYWRPFCSYINVDNLFIATLNNMVCTYLVSLSVFLRGNYDHLLTVKKPNKSTMRYPKIKAKHLAVRCASWYFYNFDREIDIWLDSWRKCLKNQLCDVKKWGRWEEKWKRKPLKRDCFYDVTRLIF